MLPIFFSSQFQNPFPKWRQRLQNTFCLSGQNIKVFLWTSFSSFVPARDIRTRWIVAIPLSFSAGWTTRARLVNKQTPVGRHFAEKLTSKCEIARTTWVCTHVVIGGTPRRGGGRLRTLARALSQGELPAELLPWTPNTGPEQPQTGAACTENKVDVTLVQKANILFSLSSQETERLHALRIARSMDIIRIKTNLNEICCKIFCLSKCIYKQTSVD